MLKMKKIDQLRNMVADGDWVSAISLASSFPQLGDESKDIRKANEAIKRPDFQRQIGCDPSVLVANGIKAIQKKWIL